MATVILTVYVRHGSYSETNVYFFFVKTCQTQSVNSFKYQEEGALALKPKGIDGVKKVNKNSGRDLLRAKTQFWPRL